MTHGRRIPSINVLLQLPISLQSGLTRPEGCLLFTIFCCFCLLVLLFFLQHFGPPLLRFNLMVLLYVVVAIVAFFASFVAMFHFHC